jgi:hypothetical protein
VPWKKPGVNAGEYRKGHFTHAQIRGSDGSLYMDRWYFLYFPRLFSIRLHHICRPDMDRWPHDHPWAFISIILRGGYVEEICTPEQFDYVSAGEPGRRHNIWAPYHTRRIHRFNFKTNTDLHRIVKFFRPQGAWTLVFTGPERRDWGFMTDKGWLSRKEFGLGGSNDYGPEPD